MCTHVTKYRARVVYTIRCSLIKFKCFLVCAFSFLPPRVCKPPPCLPLFFCKALLFQNRVCHHVSTGLHVYNILINRIPPVISILLHCLSCNILIQLIKAAILLDAMQGRLWLSNLSLLVYLHPLHAMHAPYTGPQAFAA